MITGLFFLANPQTPTNFCKFDILVFNSEKPSMSVLKEYKKQKAVLVELNKEKKWNKRSIIKSDLLSVKGGLIRHNSKKLTNIIEKIIF